MCGFQTILCLLSFKEGNEWISSVACLFLPYGKEQEVHKCIDPKHFRVSGIKISNGVTKETIAADTVAFSETVNKFSQALKGLIYRCRI